MLCLYLKSSWPTFEQVTPPKFNSSPLKSYRNPIGKGSSSNHHFFRGELLNFRECSGFLLGRFLLVKVELVGLICLMCFFVLQKH